MIFHTMKTLNSKILHHSPVVEFRFQLLAVDIQVAHETNLFNKNKSA